MIKNYSPGLLFLFLFSSTFMYSQYSVQGKVLDQAGSPISYATVILLNAEDSTSVVQGVISAEEGNFLFEDIVEKDYVLRVGFVGFKDYLKRIHISENKDLGTIVLTEAIANLDEVSITARKPTVTRKVDRLVFNVENSSLSSGDSWQILQKTPGVILVNGTLNVRNQPVEVYINDRKVQLSPSELRTLLENYSAENISSVEVITNPPARYDAEGGAILNIVTSKSISPGYKGSLSAAYTQAMYPKYSFGTSHYKKTEKLNLFANYSFNPRKEFKQDLSYINFINDQDEVFSRWDTDFNRTTHSQAHNANIILDYYLDDRNTLSFSSYAVFSPNKTFDNNAFTNISDNLNETANFFRTKSNLEEDLSNFAFNLEYKHQLKKEGAQISVKGHYTRYDQDRFQEVSTNYSNEDEEIIRNNSFFTEALQGIDIFTAQLDYVTPIGTTNFETGLKASVIDSESGIDFYDVQDGTSSFNAALSDNFLYDEKIYAGYASISKDWETWSIKAGLRGEFTDRIGESQSVEKITSREYFELFPTFYLQHRFSENHSVTFDYSRRIQRPNYADLNPFRYFLNENNFNAGNPSLRAAISNNFNLNYTFKNAYFFDLYYRDHGKSPYTLSFQDNENLTLRRVPVNLLESHSYGIDITHGRSITDFWYASAFVSVFHDKQSFVALESNNLEVINKLNGFYGYMFNSFTLSDDGTFSGNLSLTYVSGWITGSYILEPWTTLSLGLRKTLWNNRAEISLRFDDILDSTNTRLTSDYLNQDNSFLAMPETRYVRLGFKYNFGNYRLSDNERTIEAAERDRL